MNRIATAGMIQPVVRRVASSSSTMKMTPSSFRNCIYLPWKDMQEDTFIRRWARSYLESTNCEWYAGGAWLLVSLCLLIINIRYIRKGDALMWPPALLNMSAIMYVLPYFVIAVTTNFRYLYWTMLATAVAVLITGHALVRRRADDIV